MIQHFYNVSEEEIDEMAISEYRLKTELSLNLASIYRQGKFEFLTSRDKHQESLDQVAHFKSIGRL